MDISIVSKSINCIHCVIEPHLSSPRWELFCVYGPSAQHHRNGFWRHMNNTLETVEGAWCMIGDLNTLMHQYEKQGGSSTTDINCEEFITMIRERDILDLGYAGPAFTWSNNSTLNNPTFERLDRAVCNSEWRILFSDAAVLHLPRIESDHSPIILNTMRKPPKRKQNYKFEFYWADHPQFKEVMQNSWYNSAGSTISRLTTLGEGLWKWSMKTFGDTRREIEMEKQKLIDLQSSSHQRGGESHL
ncbi:uncharacterized protein LOC113359035 [Papaver somniferum]|uniref:uncharacterized protein LOC113359035 n=1 Tax=Papaver somniferum TaxID=3469 RepID=UPI000E70347A|nr:uncharacterized protein LOC113359035 [Papaver somniferum]